MNKIKPTDKVNLSFHGMGSDGEGVGYYQGYTIFVEGALPEEEGLIEVGECKKRYAKGSLLKIRKESPHRVEPICPSFGSCGGCQLMHLNYSQQLKIKQSKVLNALERIGKLKEAPVEPCLASPSSLHYRNKIQLPIKQTETGLSLGLYARASHDLIEVDRCYIHAERGEEILKTIKPMLVKSHLRAFDPKNGEGELKHLLIKSSFHFDEALVILVTSSIDSIKLKPLAEEMMRAAPSIKGVIQNLNSKSDNVILGKDFQLLAGSPFIHEKLGDFLFQVSPASFFQVNPQQAVQLYAKALELSDLKGDEVVLDAYCGVGTISLFFAKHAHKVMGIECVSSAIENAKENAKLNNIKNVEFICSQAEEHIKTLQTIDLAILNPPRKGCEKSFLDEILRLRPSKLIYISCDPATLARDLALLTAKSYKLKIVQPFDMFPQTAHVECVAKLELIT